MDSLLVFGIVLKATTNLMYVGVTRGKISEIWSNEALIGPQIRKYIESNGGYDAFMIEMIKECKSDLEAYDVERHLILECYPLLNFDLSSVKCSVKLSGVRNILRRKTVV
jgi:hypothetical protein